jgi:hypothetical protein
MSVCHLLVRGSNFHRPMGPGIRSPLSNWDTDDGHHGQASVSDLSVPGTGTCYGNSSIAVFTHKKMELLLMGKWSINGEHCHVWLPESTQNHKPSFWFHQAWVAHTYKASPTSRLFLTYVPVCYWVYHNVTIFAAGSQLFHLDRLELNEISDQTGVSQFQTVPGTCETEMDRLGSFYIQGFQCGNDQIASILRLGMRPKWDPRITCRVATSSSWLQDPQWPCHPNILEGPRNRTSSWVRWGSCGRPQADVFICVWSVWSVNLIGSSNLHPLNLWSSLASPQGQDAHSWWFPHQRDECTACLEDWWAPVRCEKGGHQVPGNPMSEVPGTIHHTQKVCLMGFHIPQLSSTSLEKHINVKFSKNRPRLQDLFEPWQPSPCSGDIPHEKAWCMSHRSQMPQKTVYLGRKILHINWLKIIYRIKSGRFLWIFPSTNSATRMWIFSLPLWISQAPSQQQCPQASAIASKRR